MSVLLAGLIASLAAIASGPVTGTIEAVKVIVGERGEESFLPADEARPQDVIEYRLKYANNGEAGVQNVSIVDPVPAGVQYIEKSAKAAGKGLVEFSVDSGKTFHTWPVKVKKVAADGRENWVNATPDMVTHIRWTVSGELKPAKDVTFSYRAKVK